jgi:hypothetical protein
MLERIGIIKVRTNNGFLLALCLTIPGLPRDDWEDLLDESRKLADEAGFYRFCLPEEFGGQNGGNLWMAAIRMHLANKGLGLFNDLQNEHSVVGNFPDILMVKEFGTEGMGPDLSSRYFVLLNVFQSKNRSSLGADFPTRDPLPLV